ncbi:MAG: HTH domain-containing protein [Paenisporosarcina sp.]
MARDKFTESQIQLIKANPHIKHVTESTISYEPDFKLNAVLENRKGKSPIQIFIEHGFDIDIIGSMTPKRCLERWRKSYDKNGEMGLLLESRGKGTIGRSSKKDESQDVTIKKLEAQLKYLKTENDFLKKIDALERKARKK